MLQIIFFAAGGRQHLEDHSDHRHLTSRSGSLLPKNKARAARFRGA